MHTSLNSLQAYMQVLAFPFRDRAVWRKITICCLLRLAASVIPLFPILFVYGYVARIMKHILNQDSDPYLPEWEQWDTLLTDGLRLFGASILTSLPVVTLTLASLGAIFLPWFIIPLAFPDPNTLSNGAILTATLVSLTGFLGLLLAILMSLPFMLVQSVVVGHVAARNSFQAMFRVAEWWPVLRAGWRIFLVEALVVLLLSWIGGMILSFLGATLLLLCLYPVLFALYTFLITLYSWTLATLAYRDSRRLLAQSS